MASKTLDEVVIEVIADTIKDGDYVSDAIDNDRDIQKSIQSSVADAITNGDYISGAMEDIQDELQDGVNEEISGGDYISNAFDNEKIKEKIKSHMTYQAGKCLEENAELIGKAASELVTLDLTIRAIICHPRFAFLFNKVLNERIEEQVKEEFNKLWI